MLKKPHLLLWLDKNIKTKEDYQLLMVAILVVFIICTKCYLSFSYSTGITADVPTHITGLSHPNLKAGFSFTK